LQIPVRVGMDPDPPPFGGAWGPRRPPARRRHRCRRRPSSPRGCWTLRRPRSCCRPPAPTPAPTAPGSRPSPRTTPKGPSSVEPPPGGGAAVRSVHAACVTPLPGVVGGSGTQDLRRPPKTPVALSSPPTYHAQSYWTARPFRSPTFCAAVDFPKGVDQGPPKEQHTLHRGAKGRRMGGSFVRSFFHWHVRLVSGIIQGV